MATRKFTSENDLTDEHKQQLKAAGIDWRTLIQKLGPLALQIIQIILGGLAGQQLQGKKQAVKAGCCDHHACCQEVLSSALQTASLAADHCCQCCEEQQACQP
jgi:hypothetical protein